MPRKRKLSATTQQQTPKEKKKKNNPQTRSKVTRSTAAKTTKVVSSLRKRVAKSTFTYEISDEEEDNACGFNCNTSPIVLDDIDTSPVVEICDLSCTTDLDPQENDPEMVEYLNQLLALEEATTSSLRQPDLPPPSSSNSHSSNAPEELPSYSSNSGSSNNNSISNFINEVMAADGSEYAGSRTTQDILADADRLLSENLHLIEANNLRLDDSVMFVSATKNSPLEVIDLSADTSLPVISPPKTIEKTGFGDCPICLDPLGRKDVASTICGHIFCMSCITVCIKKTKQCPNCRKILKLSQIHPLFI